MIAAPGSLFQLSPNAKGQIKRGYFHLMPAEQGVWRVKFKFLYHPKIWEIKSCLGNQIPKRGSWKKFSRVTESSDGMVAELNKHQVWWKNGFTHNKHRTDIPDSKEVSLQEKSGFSGALNLEKELGNYGKVAGEKDIDVEHENSF